VPTIIPRAIVAINRRTERLIAPVNQPIAPQDAARSAFRCSRAVRGGAHDLKSKFFKNRSLISMKPLAFRSAGD
jgi:hypothetical protein